MKNIFILTTLIACSNAVPGPTSLAPSENEIINTDTVDPVSPDLEDLEKVASGQEDLEILQKLANYDKKCNLQNNFKTCEKTKISSPNFKHAPRKSKYARVMILESLFVPKASLLQHRKSTLGYFYFDPGTPGKLKEAKFEVEVPNLLEKLVEEHFLGDPKKIKNLTASGKYLARLSAKVSHSNVGVETSNHMETVYDFLKDSSPEVEVLLADFPIISMKLLCRMDEEGVMDEIKNFYRRSAENIINLSQEAQIDFINHSWAPTIESLRKHMEFCERKDRIDLSVLEEYLKTQTEEFLEPIAAQSGAIVFAAVPNTLNHCLNRVCEADSYVARSITNVIRVGYANLKSSGIGKSGMAPNVWQLPHDQPNAFPGVNIIINSGIDEDAAKSYLEPMFGPMYIPSPEDISQVSDYQKWWTEDSLHFVKRGFLRVPLHGMATSWATPVALAMAIHLDSNSSGEFQKTKNHEDYLNLFSKKIFDPCANKTLNKFLF